ncbi:hypothetical protein EMCRGX_G000452 [Ephydatia muelleri]
MRVAIIGQSLFGQEVYKVLRTQGHNVVAVFTVPDTQGRPDPLAEQAQKDNVPVFKFPRWRNKGAVLSEVLEKYKSFDAELNVLPFCTQFIPMEVISHPKHGSIIYHPSLLPKHRGASAINWTLMEGDSKAGFTVFWADAGLDTGPILLQRECSVDINDTVDTLYTRFLFPEGIRAMGEAVRLIEEGKAPRIIQWEGGASYDQMWKAKEQAKIDWDHPALKIHNFIRGNDKLPGAWTEIEGKKVTLYGSRFHDDRKAVQGQEVAIAGLPRPAVVNKEGMHIFGKDGKKLVVTQVQFEDGQMISASKWGQNQTQDKLELSPEEVVISDKLKNIWCRILGVSSSAIENHSDFFKCGASSMDVTRLIEEVRDAATSVTMVNDEVYMNSRFEDFVRIVVLKNRGAFGSNGIEYDTVTISANSRVIKVPHQMLINGRFVDSVEGKTYETVNPTTEEPICKIAAACAKDVDMAVKAAKDAFEKGEWGKMNARDRGALMYRLADLMEHHKEELATLESVDSGAVYTLALKTHIGFSIDTFRYFAGWCDKIHGQTIPINNARPNQNLCITKKEPIGVCGIVVPWNYPLMMLAWKMAACLAAGNTVVLKPAEVTPLTSLKFAELTVKAGFPPGVVNIIPGKGRLVGQALVDNMDVRKIGFTGSTEVGKQIMKSCAVSNAKKVSLELGGKSPLIIFGDCDLDKAVRQGLQAVFFNKGENCIAAGRLFVERCIHDAFVTRMVEEVKKMKIGDPLDRSTAHGPQNHRAHLEKLLAYCEEGVKEGATLVYGGKRVDRKGFFMEPTIFTNVEDHMMLAREESFGPVMIISIFENGDIDGALRRANSTEYGLASGVFTKDISKALYVSDKLEAGTVFVNTYNKTDVAAPFGGFKQSGFGKDLGEEALHEYLKTKVVTFEY